MDNHTISPKKPERRVRASGSRVYHGDLRILRDMVNGCRLVRTDNFPANPTWKLSGEKNGVMSYSDWPAETIERLCGKKLITAPIAKPGQKEIEYQVTPLGRKAVRQKGVIREGVEFPDLFLDGPSVAKR